MKNWLFLVSVMFSGIVEGSAMRYTGEDAELLTRVDTLRINYGLGKIGTTAELFPIVKPMKDKIGEQYLVAKLTYVELVFSGVRKDNEELTSAIDLFIELLGSKNPHFSNPLYSTRIEISDTDLKTGLQMKSDDLRRILISPALEPGTRIDSLKQAIKSDLFKVFTGEISDSDSLSSETDSGDEG